MASRRSRRIRSALNLYRLRSHGEPSPTVGVRSATAAATVAAGAVLPPSSHLSRASRRDAPADGAAAAVAASGGRSGSRTRAGHRDERSALPAAKPIYIYPGLLRVLRHSAIALDSRCPAAVYRCAQCDASGDAPSRCSHANACAICLDDFHGRDLVRRMPCSAAHVFHTRCILNWFRANDKCPLCMDVVSAHPVPQRVRICRDTTRRAPEWASALPPREIPDQRRPRSMPAMQDPLSMRDLRRPDVVTNAREFQSGPLPRRKRGPRTYSYIVYDSVRMEVEQQHA